MFSVVKMMKEQGNQFDWSQIAIDIPSLPCFDQKKIAKLLADRDDEPTLVDSLLEEGYAALKVVLVQNTGRAVWFVVKVTGETPSATYAFNPEHEQPEAEDFAFVDCEPVRVSELEKADVLPTALIPIRLMEGFSNNGNAAYIDYMAISEGFARFGQLRAFPLLVAAYYEGIE